MFVLCVVIKPLAVNPINRHNHHHHNHHHLVSFWAHINLIVSYGKIRSPVDCYFGAVCGFCGVDEGACDCADRDGTGSAAPLVSSRWTSMTTPWCLKKADTSSGHTAQTLSSASRYESSPRLVVVPFRCLHPTTVCSGAVLGIFIWVGQSKAKQILGRPTGVVYVGSWGSPPPFG